MYIPIVHERVRAEGRRGIFVVVSADYQRYVADIREVSDARCVEKGVPFQRLFAVWEHIPGQSSGQIPSLEQES